MPMVGVFTQANVGYNKNLVFIFILYRPYSALYNAVFGKRSGGVSVLFLWQTEKQNFIHAAF